MSPSPHRPLLTKVEVASLVLGLEEAAPGLGMDVGALGHQELHIVFAAPLDGDVQSGLTWGGGVKGCHQLGAKTRPDLTAGVGGCGVWAAAPGLGRLLPRAATDL